jgi:PAS domain S-box-containing protein
MPYRISKIASQIFMLILGALISGAVVLFSITHYKAIYQIEALELQNLESVGKTASIHLNSRASFSFENSDRPQLQTWVKDVNSANQWESALKLIQVSDSKQPIVISSSENTSLIRNEGIIKKLQNERPKKAFSTSLSESEHKGFICYVFPLSSYTNSQESSYLLIEKSLEDQISEAQFILFEKVLFALGIIGILSFFIKYGLKQILKFESSTTKTLNEYSNILEKRNAELERVSLALNQTDNLIIMTDSRGKIEWLNHQNSNTKSFTSDELKNFVGRELAEVSYYSKINDVIRKVNDTKRSRNYETKVFDSDKREFWYNTTVTPILDQNGQIDSLVFVEADITRLKRAQKEISKMANFAQVNSNALIRIDVEGKVLFTNESGEKILKQWKVDANGVIEKFSVKKIIKHAFALNEEQRLNLQVNKRIFSVKFRPVIEKGFVNIYAEDITEAKLAEKQYKTRARSIEQSNLNFTDSINYALTIQRSILPSEDNLRQFFNDSFLIYKPKDIVSGDFIWMHELEPRKEYLIALADCTGHGVPGAMLSIVGHSLLNDIAVNENITSPGQMLEMLNRELISTLRQKSDGESIDGMDIGIVKINFETHTAIFSGAYQDVYWMNGQLNMIKGDRMPIGGKHLNADRTFKEHSFSFSRGDSLFLTSDGYIDQFGGPNNKKFTKKRFLELISSNSRFSMQAQSYIYQQNFEKWRGANEQIDDVALMGIKLI